jgi:hypothetical protein
MEINKAFEIISSRVEAVLLPKSFQKHSVPDTANEKTVLYTGSVAYSIVYYYDKKRIVLRSCAMDGDEPDNAWKTIATWLFDEDVDGQREAVNIGDDFAETIIGPKQVAVQKKKKVRDENGDIINDPLFFSNRMIAYFPALKDEIAYEKAHYASFRGITFADEKVLPKFTDYIKTANKRDIEKLSKSLNELYEAGDLDVKGIITYILLDSIDSDEKFEEIIAGFTPELKKVARASRNLRGKNIKPEKPKKPKKYMTDTLNEISNGRR